MWRTYLRQLQADLKRSAALILAVMVAVPAFVLLTGNIEKQQLEVTHTISKNWRGAYDILVRPKNVRTPTEEKLGIVRPNFLSDIYGGITMSQWEQIRNHSQVEIAAPIAMIGQVPIRAYPYVDISNIISPQKTTLAYTESLLTSRNGNLRGQKTGIYNYFTPEQLHFLNSDKTQIGRLSGTKKILLLDISNNGAKECQIFNVNGSIAESSNDSSTLDNLPNHKNILDIYSTDIYVNFAAIDPTAEDALTGLAKSVTAGDFNALNKPWEPKNGSASSTRNYLPVLATADLGAVDAKAEAKLRPVSDDIAEKIWNNGISAENCKQLEAAALGAPLTASQDFSHVWNRFLEDWKNSSREDPPINEILRAKPVIYQEDQPKAKLQPAFIKASPNSSLESAYPGSYHDGYREVEKLDFTDPRYPNQLVGMDFGLAGIYDPNKLSQTSKKTTSEIPLATYRVYPAFAADSKTEKVLGSKIYAPDLNPGGYLQSPPAILTNLQLLLPLLEKIKPELAEAPISAIRVKVKGITGFNKDSLEKIRVVAEQIQAQTGLTVDIMGGSSIMQREMALPAISGHSAATYQNTNLVSDQGLPELHILEQWSKKGVATSISKTVDQKSLLLFVLVLFSCGLTVSICTSAIIKSREKEIAILSAVGLRRRTICIQLLGQLAVAGTIAGLGGLGLALIGATVLNLPYEILRISLTLPISLVLVLGIGAFAILRGSRIAPILALRNIAPESQTKTWITKLRKCMAKHQINGSSPAGFGWQRTLHYFSRSLSSALAIAIAVASIMVLYWIQRQFNGQIVGTIMGNTISLQLRTPDLIAGAMLIILGLISVGVANWTNTIQDTSIYATFSAIGWRKGLVWQAMMSSTVSICLIGVILGEAIALIIIAILSGGLAGTLLPALVIALLALTIIPALAIIPALLWQRKNNIRTLLSEE